MVVINDRHGLEAGRQQQAGSRREQRGVVPPLRSAQQVAGGRPGTARPHCRGGQGGGGRSDAGQDGKGGETAGETAQDVAPA